MKLVRTIAENYRLPYYSMSPTYSICPEHGYISGEVYVCPHCEKRTEVYSRITGYYRPVQNWNDGKMQEWKERKVYDPDTSVLVRQGVRQPEEEAEQEQNCGLELPTPALFVQEHCPNCKMAEIMLQKLGFKYTEIDAVASAELTKQLGIKLTPTLVVKDGDSFMLVENAANIRKYVETKKQ